MPFFSQPRSCNPLVSFCPSAKSLSGHGTLYRAPTFMFFIFFCGSVLSLSKAMVSKKRSLEPGSGFGGFVFPVRLSGICRQPAARGWSPPQVTVPARQ